MMHYDMYVKYIYIATYFIQLKKQAMIILQIFKMFEILVCILNVSFYIKMFFQIYYLFSFVNKETLGATHIGSADVLNAMISNVY